MAQPPRTATRCPHRAAIVKAICSIGGGKYHSYQVYTDWVEMLAIALANAIPAMRCEQREQRYHDIAKRYTEQEHAELRDITPHLISAFGADGADDIVFDDVLGDIYMACNMGNGERGQFFTPYTLSRITAQINAGAELVQAIERKGFATASEPSCGSGGMCIALAATLHRQGINYQQTLHITAQDIDATCFYMTYIQLTMLSIPAVVILGDTLRLECRQQWYTPAHVLGKWQRKLAFASSFERMREVLQSISSQKAQTAPVLALQPAQHVREAIESNNQSDIESEQFALF